MPRNYLVFIHKCPQSVGYKSGDALPELDPEERAKHFDDDYQEVYGHSEEEARTKAKALVHSRK
jgi:hypothetical protein